jgi:RNA polymerase sigma factor (sigma-70 family)
LCPHDDTAEPVNKNRPQWQVAGRHGNDPWRIGHEPIERAMAATVAAGKVIDCFVPFRVSAGRAGGGRGRGDARPWLFGILTNTISRWSRTERAHYRACVSARQAPGSDGVAEQVSAHAMRGRLAAALQRLHRRDRDVLLLISWGQLSYDEVAQALDIPVGTVASRLNRARRTVRAALADPTVHTGLYSQEKQS